jgi:phage FluMu protein Com
MTAPVIACPHCTKKFRGKADMTGKKIRCPFCKEPFVAGSASPRPPQAAKSAKSAPGATAEAPGAGASRAAPPIPTTSEHDERFDVGDTELEFRCPNCAEPMPSKDATICLACGYNTLTREWGKREITIAASGQQIFLHWLPALICVMLIFLFVSLHLLYCIAMPIWMQNSQHEWIVHESMRMWMTMIVLGLILPMGNFAFKRLVLEPLPPEIKISK